QSHLGGGIHAACFDARKNFGGFVGQLRSEGHWPVVFFYSVFFDWPRTRGTCQGVCPHGVYVATDGRCSAKTGNYGFTGHFQCLDYFMALVRPSFSCVESGRRPAGPGSVPGPPLMADAMVRPVVLGSVFDEIDGVLNGLEVFDFLV